MSGFNSIASEFHVQEKVMRVRDCARARPVTRCGAGRSVLRPSNDRSPTPDLQDIQETSGLLATLFFSLAHIILGLMLPVLVSACTGTKRAGLLNQSCS